MFAGQRATRQDKNPHGAKDRLFNSINSSEDGDADDEASDASDISASDPQQIMACRSTRQCSTLALEFVLLGVQPFVFLISDEGTHFKYITKQSHQEDVHVGLCKLDSMQFCCDVLAKCNYLEELDARASHSYCMDEIVLCYPHARQMVGVPILKGQDCVGVFCVVSSTPQVSIKACRKGLTFATSLLTMFVRSAIELEKGQGNP